MSGSQRLVSIDRSFNPENSIKSDAKRVGISLWRMEASQENLSISRRKGGKVSPYLPCRQEANEGEKQSLRGEG